MYPARFLLVVSLGVAIAAATSAQKGKHKPEAWDAFEGGWTLVTNAGTFHTTLEKGELGKIIARIDDLRPCYEKHFGTKLKKNWTFTVLRDLDQYHKYAEEVTKGRKGVQGQCFRDKRIVAVLNHRTYGWLTTLSHEYAHAYYDCQGPTWLREGVASLVEVAEVKGQGKKRQMTIPVNPPRLRGLRIYQRGKHYQTILHLIRAEKEPDGYGYSYEHGWSLHYFLYTKDQQAYRSFLRAVRTKQGDLASQVEKFFKLDLDELDKGWREATAKLKAKS